MKRVLITGCGGFIGSHLVRACLANGYRVFGIDNLSRRGADVRVQRLCRESEFRFTHCDVRSFNELEHLFMKYGGFYAVLHEAGQVAVTTSVESPMLDFESNAAGTLYLLECVRRWSADSTFIFASTNKVYGQLPQLDLVEKDKRFELAEGSKPVGEDTPLDFHSPYGCSKGAAEQYVRDYHRIYGLQTLVLRQSCIYGTDQMGGESQGWLAWFVIASLLRRGLSIFGSGKQVRDVLWIDDLVALCLLAIEPGAVDGGSVFNVGGGVERSVSLLELMDHLGLRGLKSNKVRYQEWRPGDQKYYVSDLSLVETMTGWKPTVSVDEGVDRLVDWTRNNREFLESEFSLKGPTD